MEIPRTDTRYPIGNFVKKEQYTSAEIEAMIAFIEEAPALYKDIVTALTPLGIQKTYRPGSWNVQQLVHHVADIQLLHFLRMKKALTETDYTNVTLINMDAWAVTADVMDAPTENSLLMLEGITKRYVLLLRSLTNEELKKEYYHPVRKYFINQSQAIAMSAWHLRHHLEHIKIAVGR
ncbi:MAG: YfiT family bacillithiol transferase [Ilyomonas sp.]